MDLNGTPADNANYDAAGEIKNLKAKVAQATLPADLADKVNRLIYRLEVSAQRGIYSGEFEPVEKYINWITQVPFGKFTQDDLDLTHVRAMLDSTHFGLYEVKEKIL